MGKKEGWKGGKMQGSGIFYGKFGLFWAPLIQGGNHGSLKNLNSQASPTMAAQASDTAEGWANSPWENWGKAAGANGLESPNMAVSYFCYLKLCEILEFNNLFFVEKTHEFDAQASGTSEGFTSENPTFWQLPSSSTTQKEVWTLATDQKKTPHGSEKGGGQGNGWFFGAAKMLIPTELLLKFVCN